MPINETKADRMVLGLFDTSSQQSEIKYIHLFDKKCTLSITLIFINSEYNGFIYLKYTLE